MSFIAGESDAVNDRIGEGRISALRKVQKLAASYLTHPSVEWTVAVGEKGHKLTVTGYGGVELRAFPVRQPGEVGFRERIPPKEA
jgi:hypothetical protein